MALAIRTITQAISEIDVSGVRFMDIDEIPESVDPRLPVFFPEPAGFVSDFSIEDNSFGTGLTAKMTASYTLTYTFAYAPIGSERGLFAQYPEMVDKAFLILDALIQSIPVEGSVNMEIINTLNFGPVSDPSGSPFHGCQVKIRVSEFVN